MNHLLKAAAVLLTAAGLASCHGIGSGSTVQSIKIVYFPVSGDQGALLTAANDPLVTTDTVKMYECFCSNVKVYGYFTDGTVGDFTVRATLTSSDTSIVEVSRFQSVPCAFFQSDPSVWTLQPKGIAGKATLSAEFLGLKDTLEVRVDGMDGTNGAGGPAGTPAVFSLAPADTTNTGQVAVGLPLSLQLSVDLDHRTRNVTQNVTSWTLPGDPNSTMATISKAGIVNGITPTAGASLDVKPAFGSCPSFDPLASSPFSVRVGDIIAPLVQDYEPNFATDGMIAPDSIEQLKVTAPLDFRDGNGTSGSQLMSAFTSTTYTDVCDKVSHDDVNDPSGTNQTCKTDLATSCAGTVSVCATNPPTTCALTMTPCRLAASPVVAALFNNIVGKGDNGHPTLFTSTLPSSQGTATTLSADVADGTTTSVSVTALTGYPSTFPWFGVIDQANAREDVRVTASTGTGPFTLTVVRGQGGTTAQAHTAGVTFNQRSFTSDTNNPLQVTGKAGTLKSLTIDPPGTLAADGLLQLEATGVFDNSGGTATRQQHVSHLVAISAGSPSVQWASSDGSVAVSSGTGLTASTGICGGRAVIRARATTSTDTVDGKFATTNPAADADSNGNDDANDAHCNGTAGSDPLCSQVTLCVVTPTTLPEGITCAKTTTYNSGTGVCNVQ